MSRVKYFLAAALFSVSLLPIRVFAIDVAVYGSPNDNTWNTDVQSKLVGTGLFTTVDAFLLSSGTPTLPDLQSYDAVLVYTDGAFSGGDQAGLGDVLADYLDAGGGVVVGTFGFNTGSIGITGRLMSDGYSAFDPGPQSGAAAGLTLLPITLGHPVLAGVNSFNGGGSSYHSAVTLTANSTLIADWSNGTPLVAAKQLTAGNMVGLNFYPPSDDNPGRTDFWDASTDGAQLMANALLFAASPPSCPAAPRNDCSVEMTRGKLKISQKAGKAAKTKLMVNLGKPTAAIADGFFGMPDVGSATQHFCFWDSADMLIEPLSPLSVDEGAFWTVTNKPGKSKMKYNNPTGNDDGVNKEQLTEGEKGKLKLQAVGSDLDADVNLAQFDTGMTVQKMVPGGDCLTIDFPAGSVEVDPTKGKLQGMVKP